MSRRWCNFKIGVCIRVQDGRGIYFTTTFLVALPLSVIS